MQRKIFFQKCNYNYIFFVFYILVYFLNSYFGFDNYPEKFEEEIPSSELSKYYLPLQIIHFYTANFSDFLAIIPYFIRKRILRKNEENNEDIKTEDKKEKDGDLPLIYNDNKYIESEKKKNKFKILCIIVGVLDFLQKFPFVLFNLIFSNKQLKIYSFCFSTPFAIVIHLYVVIIY